MTVKTSRRLQPLRALFKLLLARETDGLLSGVTLQLKVDFLSEGPGWALQRNLVAAHLEIDQAMDTLKKTEFSTLPIALHLMIRLARFRRGAYPGPIATRN